VIIASGCYGDEGYKLPSPNLEREDSYKALLRDENGEAADPLFALSENIPGGGVPGQDYPILASIRQTDFSCSDHTYPGYFADISEEAQCQVFHICQEDGRMDSFLCPNGTLFRQEFFVCDWWFNVDCQLSPEFFRFNEQIGKIPETFRTITETLEETYEPPNQDAELPFLKEEYETTITDQGQTPLEGQRNILEDEGEPQPLYTPPEETISTPPQFDERPVTGVERTSLNLSDQPNNGGDPPSREYGVPHQEGEVVPSPFYTSPRF
ncbi:UNVERIFIED_CONTAM: hypothetical protein GTU68_060292, partial [Idotea baltica]|nr:hypothetical protein [Idotea baltica]